MTSAMSLPSRRFGARIGGLALLAIGAMLIAVGLVQTTTSHVEQASCPDGSVLLAKFNYVDHRYVFEKPSGNEGIVVIAHGTATGGDASSSVAISAVIVKGGTHAVITTYSPPQTSLHFSNAGLPLVGKGNLPDVSNVQFCRPTPPPPSSTSSSTTESVTTPTEPLTTPTEPVTTPTEPVTTPTEPVTTPTEPVTTPGTEVSGTTAPATTQPANSTTTSVEQEAVVVTSTTVVSVGSESSLPHTGAPSAVLVALGIVLLGSGMTLLVIGRARTRRAGS